MIKVWAEKVKEKTGEAYVKGPICGVDFLLDELLGIGDFVWPSIRTDLHSTFDNAVNEVVKIDGIGSGKSTFAALSVVECLYLLGHMPDPARVFGLMPNSKIAIVIMSLREAQAKSIIFDEIKQRLECPWFKKNYRHKEEGARLIKFPNRVFVLSGSSSETVPAGFNVLVGVMDEGDWFMKQSHIGDSLDQAENVYMSMKDRIETRFGEKGLTILVSSARNPEGFMLKRYDELANEIDAVRTRRPQWESKPGRWSPYFKVDLKTVTVVEENIAEYEPVTDEFVMVPHQYKRAFLRNPRKFLRDRGSIVLISTKAYVLRPDSIKFNMERPNPINPDGTLMDSFQPIENMYYYSHNDLGETRDKCVSCVGHQDGFLTVIDLIYVIDPKEEGKVDFQRVRDIFFELHRRGFVFGDEITFDSWQSRDSIQRLEARGIPAGIMSVDRDKSAYDIWLGAHYDETIDVPYVDGYMDCVVSLVDKLNKVDHTKQGQKDITDAVAGTVKHCRMAEGSHPANVVVATRKPNMPKANVASEGLRSQAANY